LPKTRL